VERVGELNVQPRAVSAKPDAAGLRMIDRLMRVWNRRCRNQPISLDEYDVYREHPELLFATDKEIVEYATRGRSHDRYEQVPLIIIRRI
jgi:hypothetical protein